MTKMKDVNAHICPTCGGQLLVDVERQMYECPFCGVTFDYDYFREESVLGIAAQALNNSEFDSASRAYGFMLEKEPDNFEALRGKALIAMNITKIDDIRNLDLYSKLDYESAYEEIGKGIEASKSSDREYFTVMKDIVDAGHEYTEEMAQLKIQKSERNSSLDRLNDYVEERDTLYIYASPRFRPGKAVLLTLICYMICCLVISLGYMLINRNPYSKAEDLSQYETTQTTESQSRITNPYGWKNNNNDAVKLYTNHQKYQEALKREEQRKINYENWEKTHDNKSALLFILGFATVIFAAVVIAIIMKGRTINAEISWMQTKTDEQGDKIKDREERMAELKDRIGQDYQRLCELHQDDEGE